MMRPAPRIQACLNGGRARADVPIVPETPGQVRADARDVAGAGACAIHVHPRDAAGRQTLDPAHVAASVRAARAGAPSLRVGVTTGAWIERDPARRLALVAAWGTLPDFASVNFGEAGAEELAEALLARGVGVEAGIWSVEDAGRLAASSVARRCERILLEPREREAAAALATAHAADAVLREAQVPGERLLHGSGVTAWPVLEHALRHDLATRIGLEDAIALPDGTSPVTNLGLMAAAMVIAMAGPGD